MKHRFDPQEYLAANPDVAKAVEERRVRSAWSHFVDRGFLEGRGGVPDAIRRAVRAVMEASLPMPPARVLAGPNGASGAADFELGGKIAALDVYSAVVPVLHLDRPLRILDFGCGYGRVLRFLGEAAPLSVIQAADADGEAIAWCRETYRDEVRRGRYSFVVSPQAPPLPFSPGYFDLVCALSVLTRMPGRLQLQWLSELRRITRPEGFLALPRLGDSLARYFAVLDQIPSGLAGQQDLVLCMKHPSLVI